METKKWGRISAWLILLLPFLCVAAVAAMGAVLFLHLRHLEVTIGDIQTLLYLSMACIGLCAAAVILGAVVLRKHAAKKGKVITGMILSVLLILIFGAILLGYQYIMSAFHVNTGFRNLSDEDLGIIDVSDGIDRTQDETLVDLSSVLDSSLLQEVQRSLLDPKNLPPEILAFMHQAEPVGKSYLLPGYDKIKTFVLFGLDYGEASDVIMLVTIDPVHHKIKLDSVARDSFVRMPQWGSYSKLNYAYTWGGSQLAIKTLNYNYFMNLKDYVTLDFSYMEKLVDYFGGVDIELDEYEVRYLRLECRKETHVGMCHLDGETALDFVRMRYANGNEGDLVRTNRQRRLVSALMAKLKQSPVSSYPRVVRECMKMCDTSMNAAEILTYCLEVAQNDYTVEESVVPRDYLDSTWYEIGGNGFLVYDLFLASDRLYRNIFEELYVSGYED